MSDDELKKEQKKLQDERKKTEMFTVYIIIFGIVAALIGAVELVIYLSTRF